MLVNRLKHLIKNNIVKSDKIMLKYGVQSLTYYQFLKMIKLLESYFDFSDYNSEITHIYYETSNPLITLLMFFYTTSKDKVYIMLPADIDETSEMLVDDQTIVIGCKDELIDSLIKTLTLDSVNSSVNKNYNVAIKKEELEELVREEVNLNLVKEKLFLRAYSSGTSGMRKEVERTFNSWFSAFDTQNEVFKISSGTKAYIQGDINYTGNLNYALGVLHAGGTLVLGSKKGPKELIDLIEKLEVNSVFLVPTVLGILSRYINKKNRELKLRNVDITIITAGEKLQEYVYENLKMKFESACIIEYYGASEVGHISYSVNDEILIGNGYVGKLFEGVGIKIIEGKIYTSSPYHAKNHGGYICAGDYGDYIDECLYIYGRGSNIISRSAKMINTEEIRSIISSRLNCESYVCSYKDTKRGENYILILKSNLSQEDVYSELEKMIDKVSMPEELIIVGEIETKSSGKIDYKYYLELCDK